MTEPGDHDAEQPRQPSPPPHPGADRGVAEPRFGDMASQEYRPDYGDQPPSSPPVQPPPSSPPAPQPPAPQPPARQPPAASFSPTPTTPTQAPPARPAAQPAPAARPDRSVGMIVPIAAGLAILLGIGFLVLRGGSDGDSIATTDTSLDTTVETDPEPEPEPDDDPLVASTLPDPVDSGPIVTSPPLVQPSTTVATTSTTTPTTVPAPVLPTNAQLAETLTSAGAFGPNWTETSFVDDDTCSSSEFDEFEVAFAGASFEETVDATNFRVAAHTVTTYQDADIAAAAFEAEVAAIEACSGTTVDLGGLDYRVDVLRNDFSEEESATFPCRDDNSTLGTTFTNTDALIPLIASTIFGFRCGANVVAVSYASTVALTDLQDPRFISAAVTANIATASLPGS